MFVTWNVIVHNKALKTDLMYQQFWQINDNQKDDSQYIMSNLPQGVDIWITFLFSL